MNNDLISRSALMDKVRAKIPVCFDDIVGAEN